jgi:hypothetical protein
VIVYNEGKCASTTAEYEILLGTSADPSLTMEADDATAVIGWHVLVNGTASIP